MGPKINVDCNYVKDLKKQGLKMAEIAQELGIHPKTLSRNLNREGLSNFKANRATTDEALLEEVVDMNNQFPGYGANQLWYALKTRGIFVTQKRVRQMLRIVDPSGVFERSQQMRRIARIEYWVPHSHALWHIDGYLKLGPYKLVIRGGIDGFSRTMVFLEVGTRNTGADMLASFKSGVDTYTTPLRVRSDKGKEMREVARFMRQARPGDDKCFITGRSVRNQKIERWWGDLRKFCVGKFINLFKSMERRDWLDTSDPVDIACLHEVFFEIIQADLQQFRLNYNTKGIRTFQMRSPSALLREKPMPRELVVSEPRDDLDMNPSVSDAALTEEGREFNAVFVAEHIYTGARMIKRELMSPLNSDLSQQYLELRSLVQDAHKDCEICLVAAQ